ncbi:uncharacterized protein LOC142339516 isoform X4 [Convolutriloba macropyga]|uniref:uncharacterized protein LOC142339516 isoform X4 n=1 Tax=Convolutriloba macropyga TaxID=536237 RepID=UPI003F526519
MRKIADTEPISFLKALEEVIFNSLDARSNCIACRVDIASASFTVIDDGLGLRNLKAMSRPGFTSKGINNTSHGFKGNSLYQIRKWCRELVVQTMCGSQDQYSTCAVFRNCKFVVYKMSTRSCRGTSVTVRNLHFRNFVAKKVSGVVEEEMFKIRRAVSIIAIANPSVSLSLLNMKDESVVCNIEPKRSFFKVMRQIFSYKFKKRDFKRIYCEDEASGCTAVIFVANTGVYAHVHDLLFVNRRPVNHAEVHDQILRHKSSSSLVKNKLLIAFLALKAKFFSWSVVIGAISRCLESIEPIAKPNILIAQEINDEELTLGCSGRLISSVARKASENPEATMEQQRSDDVTGAPSFETAVMIEQRHQELQSWRLVSWMGSCSFQHSRSNEIDITEKLLNDCNNPEDISQKTVSCIPETLFEYTPTKQSLEDIFNTSAFDSSSSALKRPTTSSMVNRTLQQSSPFVWKAKLCHDNDSQPEVVNNNILNNKQNSRNFLQPSPGCFFNRNATLLNPTQTTTGSEFYLNCEDLKTLKIIGQFGKKFILASKVDSTGFHLIAIDQHAAHERLRLHHLIKNAFTSGSPNSSLELKSAILVESILLPLDKTSYDFIVMKKLLRKFGIFEFFEENGNVIINSLPSCVVNSCVVVRKPEEERKSFYTLIAKDIVNECVLMCQAFNQDMPKCVLELLKLEACRYAIKFGDVLSLSECQELISWLGVCESPFICAHGRPSVVSLAFVKDKGVDKQSVYDDYGPI